MANEGLDERRAIEEGLAELPDGGRRNPDGGRRNSIAPDAVAAPLTVKLGVLRGEALRRLIGTVPAIGSPRPEGIDGI